MKGVAPLYRQIYEKRPTKSGWWLWQRAERQHNIVGQPVVVLYTYRRGGRFLTILHDKRPGASGSQMSMFPNRKRWRAGRASGRGGLGYLKTLAAAKRRAFEWGDSFFSPIELLGLSVVAT